MIRGTTPTHVFNIAFDASELKSVRITYAQNDEVVITKETDDCKLKGNKITTTLTQEETLKLNCKKRVQIQLRALTKSGVSLSTLVKIVPVDKCLDNEVLQ